MKVTFPAVTGVQGSSQYFVINVKYNEVVRFFEVFDQNLPVEERSQRSLDPRRIPKLVEYITSNKEGYVLPTLTAIFDGRLTFTPIDDIHEPNIGIASINMDDKLHLLDGQHRLEAIKIAIKEHPELGVETIPILLYCDFGKNRQQQLFVDINKNARKTPQSLNFLFDHRNENRDHLLEIVKTSKLFDGNVEMEKTSVTKSSTKLFSLHTIQSIHKKFNLEKNKTYLIKFWDRISELIDSLSQDPKELKTKYLITHSVMMDALSLLAKFYIDRKIESMPYLENLQDIDWTRENWKGTVVLNGQVRKSKATVQSAFEEIAMYLGIVLP